MEPIPTAARIDELLAHSTWARGLALSLVRDPGAADDIVQEAWVAALRSPPDLDRPVRPWLATVIRNLARMRFRSEDRRTRREEAAARPEAAHPSAADLAERLDTQRRLAGMVLDLPEPYRTTLLMRYVEGLEPSDIAARLGEPAATVRSRVKRGLDTLRARLDREHGDRAAWLPLVGALSRPPGGGATAEPHGPAQTPRTGERRGAPRKRLRTVVVAAAAVMGVVAVGVGVVVGTGALESADAPPPALDFAGNTSRLAASPSPAGEAGRNEPATRRSLPRTGGASHDTNTDGGPAAPALAPGELQVVVFGPGGFPQRNALVYLLPPETAGVWDVEDTAAHDWTDADGRCAFAGLSGPVSLGVRARGLVPTARSVDPSNGVAVTIELEGGGPVRGTVVDLPSRELLPGAAVSLERLPDPGKDTWLYFGAGASARLELESLADEQGVFGFDGLAPGRYAVVVAAPGHAGQRFEIDAPRSEWAVALARTAEVVFDVTGGPRSPTGLWLKVRRDADDAAFEAAPLAREATGRPCVTLGPGVWVAQLGASGSGTVEVRFEVGFRGDPVQVAVHLSPAVE